MVNTEPVSPFSIEGMFLRSVTLKSNNKYSLRIAQSLVLSSKSWFIRSLVLHTSQSFTYTFSIIQSLYFTFFLTPLLLYLILFYFFLHKTNFIILYSNFILHPIIFLITVPKSKYQACSVTEGVLSINRYTYSA